MKIKKIGTIREQIEAGSDEILYYDITDLLTLIFKEGGPKLSYTEDEGKYGFRPKKDQVWYQRQEASRIQEEAYAKWLKDYREGKITYTGEKIDE